MYLRIYIKRTADPFRSTDFRRAAKLVIYWLVKEMPTC